ncbi:tyrosine-type recombinase/integrase [Burkholderia ubonensis]|uniref:tyrosine-type recombinase/integrase n=1 Tax=Burkholderia ubonensis TaxID=101571 RepID=UPI002FCA16C8
MTRNRTGGTDNYDDLTDSRQLPPPTGQDSQAFARAGFRPACRGAAHLFRHGVATTMIRHGASIAEIAEVLRHRSPDSTAIYAKVAFEDLQGVARSWPSAGGAI